MLLLSSALAGEFLDTWVTTALEDTNLLAQDQALSPTLNFVTRGNSTFFENYESRFTDDISQSYLALYRRDEGFLKNISTEAAFVLRFEPYLNPDRTEPGVAIRDDGSYVRIEYQLGDRKDHSLSLTGYAVDANRFRLGYSYDLTWGSRSIFTTDPLAAPGVRLQYQNGGAYAFFGAKTAIGDKTDEVTDVSYNHAYYGLLAGGGAEIGKLLRIDLGAGSFQQGELIQEALATSTLYGEIIRAAGVSGQIAFRTNPELAFVTSNELKLIRNAPDFVRDTYITHRKLEGFGLLLQAEGNYIAHNLLDADAETDSTTIEGAFAGDLQALAVAGTTEIAVDLVYKDLPYIVFNVPGLTSGYSISENITTTPQVYGRARIAHFFEGPHLTPSLGAGLMQPATFRSESSETTYVVATERDQYGVPTGQAPAALLSAVAGIQWDVSKSVVLVGEILYTVNNNISEFVVDENGNEFYVPAPANERNALGANVMMRARF